MDGALFDGLSLGSCSSSFSSVVPFSDMRFSNGLSLSTVRRLSSWGLQPSFPSRNVLTLPSGFMIPVRDACAILQDGHHFPDGGYTDALAFDFE